MRTATKLISSLAITLVCVTPAIGKAWRGITPLSSTRADVERLLGQPEPGTQAVYKTSEGVVKVSYAKVMCDYGWRVPLNTVISLMIYPTTPLKLTELKLDERKYEKRRDLNLENVYYYISAPEGINYTVDSVASVVTAIEYYPTTSDERRKCSVGGSGSLKSTPKTSPNPRSRRKTKGKQPTANFSCPMHPDYVAAEPGFCPRCGTRLRGRSEAGSTITSPATPSARTTGGAWNTLSAPARIVEMERLAPSLEYTCLMHRAVHEAHPGVCPKCGMPLTQVNPSVLGEYKLELTPVPSNPRPGEKTLISFTISTPQNDKRVRDFVVTHEKLLHLFIVSEDLSDYQHVHPQISADGTFSVETVLSRPGRYKIHADFFPISGTPQILHRELVTEGFASVKQTPPALTTDKTLVKSVDGMTIKLEPGGPFVAGSLVPLTYHLNDSITGQPVRDLEPYLGAWGHTLILNADQSEYLHTHPSEMLSTGADRATLRGGPAVQFKSMFPSPGDYRIWTQFQRAGKVTTVSFTVRVQSQ